MPSSWGGFPISGRNWRSAALHKSFFFNLRAEYKMKISSSASALCCGGVSGTSSSSYYYGLFLVSTHAGFLSSLHFMLAASVSLLPPSLRADTNKDCKLHEYISYLGHGIKYHPSDLFDLAPQVYYFSSECLSLTFCSNLTPALRYHNAVQ